MTPGSQIVDNLTCHLLYGGVHQSIRSLCAFNSEVLCDFKAVISNCAKVKVGLLEV